MKHNLIYQQSGDCERQSTACQCHRNHPINCQEIQSIRDRRELRIHHRVYHDDVRTLSRASGQSILFYTWFYRPIGVSRCFLHGLHFFRYGVYCNAG
jgi:hypothetical protein